MIILLDDVGFGQTSTFGGLIPTPTLDRIASESLRYNRLHVKAPKALAVGDAHVELDFNYDGGGVGKGAGMVLKVNGQSVGQGRMKASAFGRFGVDTFGVGEDSGQPVTPDYQAPFRFTGIIDKVVITLGPANLSQADADKIRRVNQKAAVGVD